MSAPQAGLREGFIPVERARLYFREVGSGKPIVVLHGGPDFDHTYLLPEMDRLAETFRLIYYDQRGRGRSAEGVEPEDVTIASDVADLEQLRREFKLDHFTVLGHSWGGVLAMEYAVAHPDRAEKLILMNSAPASYEDRLLFSRHLQRVRPPDEAKQMVDLSARPDFLSGNIEAEAAYYRIHFRSALPHPGHVDEIVGRLRVHFTEESVLLARAIEHRLYEQTWLRPNYDLLAKLRAFRSPTLVIHGQDDFVPLEVPQHIATAVPGAALEILVGAGHFPYLEQPDRVQQLVTSFIG